MNKQTEALIARLREEATYDLNHETIALLIEAAEALAPTSTTCEVQPEQEPVASNFQAQWLGNALFDCIKASGIIRKDIGSLSVAELLFFSQDLKGMLERQAATRAQTEQEPVGDVNRYGLDSHGRKWHGIHWYNPNVDVPHGTKLYTAPPKRTWVGLTRLERFEIEEAMSKYYDYQHQCKTVCLPEFAAAYEAKLKEKNT